MAYSKKEAGKTRQKVSTGTKVSSETLDGTTTSEVIVFGHPVEKVTVQSTETLAGNFEVSVNGLNFVAGAAFTAGALVSYNTHNVAAIRVNRTGGTGKLAVAAV